MLVTILLQVKPLTVFVRIALVTNLGVDGCPVLLVTVRVITLAVFTALHSVVVAEEGHSGAEFDDQQEGHREGGFGEERTGHVYYNFDLGGKYDIKFVFGAKLELKEVLYLFCIYLSQ